MSLPHRYHAPLELDCQSTCPTPICHLLPKCDHPLQIVGGLILRNSVIPWTQGECTLELLEYRSSFVKRFHAHHQVPRLPFRPFNLLRQPSLQIPSPRRDSRIIDRQRLVLTGRICPCLDNRERIWIDSSPSFVKPCHWPRTERSSNGLPRTLVACSPAQLSNLCPN